MSNSTITDVLPGNGTYFSPVIKYILRLAQPNLGIIVLLIFAASFISTSAQKELSAPASDDHRPTLYDGLFLVQDTIYIFYKTEGNTDSIGALRLVLPDTGSYTVSLYKYDTDSGTFSNLIGTNSGVHSFTDFGALGEGAYQAVTKHDSVGVNLNDTSNVAWIMVYDRNPNPKFRNKNAQGALTGSFRCTRSQILAMDEPDTLNYFDLRLNPPVPKVFTYKHYSYTLKARKPGETDFEVSQGELNGEESDLYNGSPHYDTLLFTLSATDTFSNTYTDEAWYYPIATKAIIHLKNISVSQQVRDALGYPDEFNYYASEGDADTASLENTSVPVHIVVLNDSSKNAVKYVWDFDIPNFPVDTNYLKTDSIYFIYTRPKSLEDGYNLKLTTISANEQCKDSATLLVLTKEQSTIKAPTFFSPNGLPYSKEENNVFRFYEVSIVDFQIRIYSRWGNLMHSYEGSARLWPGWDGTIQESGREAPPGVYYYYLKAKGGDGVNYAKSNDFKKGFVHLFRPGNR